MAGKTNDPNFDKIYNREWFLGHHQLRGEYREVAGVIHRLFGKTLARSNHTPTRALDVGCGMAFVLERLSELGWSVVGVDGSSLARELAPKGVESHIHVADLTEPCGVPNFHDLFDLVICTEVAEHLESQYSDVFVDNVVSRADGAGVIFFTAATPGQGGNDHVNEQPHQYWVDKFEDRGWRVDLAFTAASREQLVAQCPGMHWFGKNTLVFR